MGKTVLVGVPFYKKKSRIDTLKLHFGKTIVGSHGGSTNPSKDIIKYMNLLNKKNINLKNLISKVYPLSKINNAIKDYSQSKLIGKPIIKM